MKRWIKALLRSANAELVRYRSEEQAMLAAHQRFGIRDLRVLEVFGAHGQISVDESRFLGELVRQSDRTRPIIEVGTLFGHSARVIAMNKDRTQELITVDNYCWNPLGLAREAHLLATRLALREAIETQNTKVLDMDTGTFYAGYSGPPPALFFCDANHAYEAVKADLEWARRVGTSIICGDDYDPAQHQGVVRAVDEMGGPRALVDGLFVI